MALLQHYVQVVLPDFCELPQELDISSTLLFCLLPTHNAALLLTKCCRAGHRGIPEGSAHDSLPAVHAQWGGGDQPHICQLCVCAGASPEPGPGGTSSWAGLAHGPAEARHCQEALCQGAFQGDVVSAQQPAHCQVSCCACLDDDDAAENDLQQDFCLVMKLIYRHAASCELHVSPG